MLLSNATALVNSCARRRSSSRFVSGACSAAVGGGKFEIEIQTRREFRRRGLARAVAAALILYGLEHGIEACWDAANEPSAALARQLGFRSTGKYEAYRLQQPV
jgi:RimJ/RimL family protein N-acetyltransferase